MVRKMNKLKVGLIGSSQLSFPGDVEGQFERSVSELKLLSEQMNFDLWVYTKSVIVEKDAEAAVAEAERNHVDFLLAQSTSFSAGSLAPVLAKIKNAYLGLWAIPESTSEGVVPFNSFCSMNMYGSIIGNYLKDYKIPFKWFYGNAGHQLFDKRVAVTVRALTAIKNMRSAKIALVGGIAPGFNDLYFDERRILKTFDGLKINRLHEFSEISDLAMSYTRDQLYDLMAEMQAMSSGAHPRAIEMIETNARVYKAFSEFVEANGYDALAVSCWPKFQQAFKLPFSVCSVVAKLNDNGIATACEGDLPSAVSMLLLKYISGDETMLMDLSSFDEADETVLMWHCGPASKRFAGERGYTLGVNYTGLPHEKGKEPNCCGIAREMVFRPQHVTIARITGECERMFVAEGDFIDYDKKSYFGSRGWMGNIKLNGETISVRDYINTILVKRFQHHYPIVGGNYSNEVMEAAAWLGMKTVEKVTYKDYLQNEE